MDFLDAISTDLPAPRDDEPAGLRQDILDELADHLACSYNRELLRGANPGEARLRAIERFGNPAAVARRLWLDAMKGKIMAQRVLIATCLVMVLACFGVVGLVWSRSNRASAEVAEANRRLAEVLGQNQATNQEMLRQLQAMAKPAAPANSAEWIPVTFKLTVEKPDGPPAVGYEVALGRGYGGSVRAEAIHRRTDATGLADFGVVQPGDWEFMIQAGGWQTTAGLNVVPGTSVAKEIVVPKVPPDRAQVRVRVDWPTPLADKGLIAVALFRPRPLSYQPPIRWASLHEVQIACGPRGEQAEVRSLAQFRLDDKNDLDQSGTFQRQGDEILARNRVHAHLGTDLSTASGEPTELVEGRYVLARLLILRGEPQGNQYELLAEMGSSDQNGIMIYAPGQRVFPLIGTRISPSWRDKLDHFEARPDRVAEWVIPLPENLTRAAEKKLKAEANAVTPG
jgi:hypothetical protein